MRAVTWCFDFYDWTLQFADPRVAHWPLISSPLPTILIVLLYYVAVYTGPKFMKNRWVTMANYWL